MDYDAQQSVEIVPGLILGSIFNLEEILYEAGCSLPAGPAAGLDLELRLPWGDRVLSDHGLQHFAR